MPHVASCGVKVAGDNLVLLASVSDLGLSRYSRSILNYSHVRVHVPIDRREPVYLPSFSQVINSRQSPGEMERRLISR